VSLAKLRSTASGARAMGFAMMSLDTACQALLTARDVYPEYKSAEVKNGENVLRFDKSGMPCTAAEFLSWQGTMQMSGMPCYYLLYNKHAHTHGHTQTHKYIHTLAHSNTLTHTHTCSHTYPTPFEP
jgi:hypothetical protein